MLEWEPNDCVKGVEYAMAGAVPSNPETENTLYRDCQIAKN